MHTRTYTGVQYTHVHDSVLLACSQYSSDDHVATTPALFPSRSRPLPPAPNDARRSSPPATQGDLIFVASPGRPLRCSAARRGLLVRRRRSPARLWPPSCCGPLRSLLHPSLRWCAVPRVAPPICGRRRDHLTVRRRRHWSRASTLWPAPPDYGHS